MRRRGRLRRPRRIRILFALGSVVIVVSIYSTLATDVAVPRATIRGLVTCKNTFGSSASLVADSRGNLCAVTALGENGCCGEILSSKCSSSESCCENYEDCVAKCASADSSLIRDVRSRASHALLATKDDWEFCRFRCLTNSGSVLHQNSYRSRLKHCFGAHRAVLDPTMSINSVDPHNAPDPIDLDLEDPYVAGPPLSFPCKTEGCAVPEQDRALLHKDEDRSSRTGRSPKNDEHPQNSRRPLVLVDRLTSFWWTFR